MNYYELVNQLSAFVDSKWNSSSQLKVNTVSLVASIIDNSESKFLSQISYLNRAQVNTLTKVHSVIEAEVLKVNKIIQTVQNSSNSNYSSGRLKSTSGDFNLDEAMETFKIGLDKYMDYLKTVKIDIKPSGKTKRLELMNYLHDAFVNQYNGNYIKRNCKSNPGTRIHNDFTEVAIVFDRLFGDPSPALSKIPYELNGALNIQSLTNHDSSEINNFAKYIEVNFP